MAGKSWSICRKSFVAVVVAGEFVVDDEVVAVFVVGRVFVVE
jgi:hypothetical protein